MDGLQKLRIITYLTPGIPLSFYEAIAEYLQDTLKAQVTVGEVKGCSGPTTVGRDPLSRREADLAFLSAQQAMGDVSRATFAGGQITWKRSKDSTVLDTDRLLNDNPDLKARYSKVKEGSRRFLIS